MNPFSCSAPVKQRNLDRAGLPRQGHLDINGGKFGKHRE